MENWNGIRISLYLILPSALQTSMIQKFKGSGKVVTDEIATCYFPRRAKLFSWLEKSFFQKNLSGLGKTGA